MKKRQLLTDEEYSKLWEILNSSKKQQLNPDFSRDI